MDIKLDCLPCTLRQALEASRLSTDSTAHHAKIMDETVDVLRRYKTFKNPPEIAREIHRIVKKITGNQDPYGKIKQKDLSTALGLYPKLKEFIGNKEDQLYWALRASAVGNTLDSAIYMDYDLEKNMYEELLKPFVIYDIISFEEKLATAKKLLVIGDNTGETVFDRLLLRQFPSLDITYAVRSAPIINDATVEDAKASGLGRYAAIKSTGCNAPGVLLNECNKEFLDIYYNSDIVISKGQGNYETLWDSNCGRGIYFLLKVKCTVLSQIMGIDLGQYVFKYREEKVLP
ncbi:MAG: DUF89 family protein [Clostridia bacterium]|nr:DUF89 family protein [Clostridia bacterium]